MGSPASVLWQRSSRSHLSHWSSVDGSDDGRTIAFENDKIRENDTNEYNTKINSVGQTTYA